MLRRETIIALRARHTAFRIAVEILYPQQPPPPAAQPAMPVLEDGEQARADWEALIARRAAREEHTRRTGRVLALILSVLALAYVSMMVYAVFLAQNTPPPPPPPPQARPILPAG